MEVAWTTETLASNRNTIWHHNPDDPELNSSMHERTSISKDTRTDNVNEDELAYDVKCTCGHGKCTL